MSEKDKGMKSAYELAMDRLNASGEENRTLSDEQKAAIADIDKKAKAKIAELEIMHKQNLEKVMGDLQALHGLECALHEGVQKTNDQAEAEKDAVRAG
jgi:uncharacterized protein YecT (DUF1311 family)